MDVSGTPRAQAVGDLVLLLRVHEAGSRGEVSASRACCSAGLGVKRSIIFCSFVEVSLDLDGARGNRVGCRDVTHEKGEEAFAVRLDDEVRVFR